MEITRRVAEHWTELFIEGRLDGYWAEHLDAGLADVIRDGNHRLRLDLTGVTFISSAGIGVLVKFYKRLDAIKGTLVIVRASPAVLTVLDMTRLTALLGEDMTRWRWDAVHKAVFAHSSLDTVAVLGGVFRRTAPHGGDWSTVNVGPVFAPKPFEQHSLPGYRQIVDLSPANDSRFLDAVGQSGHFLSSHYADFLPDWHDVKHRKMRMERADIDGGALGHLRLRPPQ